MSYQVATQDAYDGYLSDVPSQASFAQSEVSNDLIVSTKVLEKHFKEKYNALKLAYEQRIKQLSDVVHDTCNNLITDEILLEMRNDKTSSAFIPAHLSEIINNHLESEREHFIHQIVSKVSSLELELVKSMESNRSLTSKISQLEKDLVKGKQCEVALPPLKEKLNTLEAQYKDVVKQTDKEISELKDKNIDLIAQLERTQLQLDNVTANLKEKIIECNSFKVEVEERNREVMHLEQSFEQSNRELLMIEDMDKQEQVIKRQLTEKLTAVTMQRNELHNEVELLETKLSHALEELKKSQEFQHSHAHDEGINKERISSLMSQVESMLTQEANESNAAISTIHDKMKQFRTRMSQELQREKRFSSALNEEMLRLKTQNGELVNENRRLVEEMSHCRDKLKHEQSKIIQLNSQISEQTTIISNNKMKTFESDNVIKSLEQKLASFEAFKRQEIALIEEKVKFVVNKENEREHNATESKAAAYRMMYQNDLGTLQNQLRHSYTFGSTADPHHTSMMMASGAMDPTDLSTELSFKHAVESWSREKTHLVATHQEEIRSVKVQYEETVKVLQSKLSESSHSLEKMKKLLLENQSAMAHQVTSVEGLQQRYNTQQHILEATQKQLHQLQQYQLQASKQLNKSINESHQNTSNDVNRSRVSSVDTSTSNYSVDSTTRHQQSVNHTQQSIAEKSHHSVASSKAPSVATSNTARLPVPHNIYNKMLQGQTPASPQIQPQPPSRTASPSAHHSQTPPRRDSNASSAVNAQLQAQLQQSHSDNSRLTSDIARLKTELHEAELRLQTEKKNSGMLKSTLQSQFEGLLNNYRLLQTQFEASQSAHATFVHNSTIEREQAIKSAVASISRLDEDSVFDLTTITPRNIDHHLMPQETPQPVHPPHHVYVDQQSFEQQHNQTMLSIASATKHLEESLQHQVDLNLIATTELSVERERTLNTKKRESKLFQLLIEVDNQYKKVIQELRTELRAIKNAVLDYTPFITMETTRTVAELELQLERIFTHNRIIHESDVKAIRISLSNAHEREMKLLEERFIAQVAALNKQHSTELNRVHNESISKAERVVNGLHLDNDTLKRISSQASLTEELSRAGSFGKLPAFESVMKGIMDALTSSEIVDNTQAQQINSLATAHNEPSFAATAAAKSLLTGHIDHFLSAHSSASHSKVEIVEHNTSLISELDTTYLSTQKFLYDSEYQFSVPNSKQLDGHK